VPRSLKERALEVGRANQELTQRLGRQPTPEDIAIELDLDVDEVVEALASRSAYRLGSIDTPHDDDGASISDGLASDMERLGDDDWHEVGAALALLPQRERLILEMRFYHDMTQSEIAAALGISQMHVSRLLSRALDRARSLIA
jgi:RNA polymerase sigma-B factor